MASRRAAPERAALSASGRLALGPPAVGPGDGRPRPPATERPGRGGQVGPDRPGAGLDRDGALPG